MGMKEVMDLAAERQRKIAELERHLIVLAEMYRSAPNDDVLKRNMFEAVEALQDARRPQCCVCDSQATHECDYTGQFVCGAKLCDQCEGYDNGNREPGLGWGFMSHCHRKAIKASEKPT